jgi:hypothetical protein
MSYGFAMTGRRAKYYDRGTAPKVDAIVMSLDLVAQRSLAAPHH